MSKLFIIGIVIVILIVAGIFVFSGNSDNSVSNDNFGNSVGTTGQVRDENDNFAGADAISPSSNSDSGTVRIPSEYTIDISGFAFSSSTINIKAGDSIIWVNKDSAGHTVTSDSGRDIDSVILRTGESYTHIFNQPGTFPYHCALHSGMKGKIVVE